MDLTKKRCLSKLKALDRKACDHYEKAFEGHVPSDQFWLEIDELETNLEKTLAIRPLGNMAIDTAIATFGKGFKKAVADERARTDAARGGSGAA